MNPLHWLPYVPDCIRRLRDPLPLRARVTERCPVRGGMRLREVVAWFRDGVSGRDVKITWHMGPYDQPDLIRSILIHCYGFHPRRVALDRLPEDEIGQE